MKTGYIRGIENSKIYNLQFNYLNNLGVEKIFHERTAGNIKLNELADYVRKGDLVFIYSIENLGKNIRSVIRFIMSMEEIGVNLIIHKEELDSTTELGKSILVVLEALDNINDKIGLMERTETPHTKGRIPRELLDLEAYKKLVENREMTVAEVCEELNIGRTTYYRRIKALEKIDKKQ